MSEFRAGGASPVRILLLCGLTLAAFDVTAAILLENSNAFQSSLRTGYHLALSAAAVLGLITATGIAAGLPLKAAFRLPPAPLALALAAAAAVPVILRAFTAGSRLGFADLRLYSAALMLAVSVCAGIAVYFAAHCLVSDRRREDALAAAVTAAPFAMLAALGAAWVRVYRMETGFSMGSAAFAVAACGGVCGVFFALRHPAARVWAQRFTFALAAGLALLIVFHPILATPRFVQHESGAAAGRPVERVILISIDTLRRDALSAYSPNAAPTPHLDALARDGVMFKNSSSPSPWTLPAMASVMTGLSPFVHGVSRRDRIFPAASVLLPGVLSEAGYATAATGANGLLAGQLPLREAFEEFRFVGSKLPDSLSRLVLTAALGKEASAGQNDTERITRLAERWVRANRANDFFLWVHYFDPHTPYIPPREFVAERRLGPPSQFGLRFDRQRLRDGVITFSEREKEWTREVYRGEVRYVDDRVGRLMDKLRELDLYDGSLIVVTSDHGEEFWEHGNVTHGHSLYEELLAVPLIVKLPAGMEPKRQVVEAPVSTVSIMPTILELCGIETGGIDFSGPSLVPYWDALEEPESEEPFFYSKLVYFEGREAVVHGGWKYIQLTRSPLEELYDLEEDPGETMNLAAAAPEQKERLRQLLDGYRQSSRELAKRYGLGRPASPEEEQRMEQNLKSLGYIQ